MNRLQASLLGAFLTLGLAAHAQAPAQGPKQNVAPGAAAQVLPDFADLVEKYGPAVVNINTRTRAGRGQVQVPGLSEDDPFYEFFRRFMPDGQVPGPESSSSIGGALSPFGKRRSCRVSARAGERKTRVRRRRPAPLCTSR